MADEFRRRARDLLNSLRARAAETHDRVFNRLEGAALRRPGLFGSAAATALLAPLFLKNDERGYLQTAEITTPLTIAAAMVAPRLLSTTRREAGLFSAFAKEVPSRWNRKNNWVSIKGLQDKFQRGSVPRQSFEQALANWYTRPAAGDTFEREATALGSQLEKLAPSFERHQAYLSNVLHAELLRTLGAGPLSEYLKSVEQQTGHTGVAPKLGFEDFTSTVSREIAGSNQGLVRGLNAHLMNMQQINDPGGSLLVSDSIRDSTRIEALKWRDSQVARSELSRQHRELFETVRRQIRDKNLNPQFLEVIRSNTDANQLIALRYRDLTIPIVNNGTIRTGENFDRMGISRLFYDGTGKAQRADVYAVNMLQHGTRPVREELARASLIGGVDPLEEFSAFRSDGNYSVNFGSQAALRSKQAIPSNLTGFGKEGWGQLSPEQREGALQHVIRGGKLTKVGSEAGVADGVLELAETEMLGLFGRPNVEKQNQVWRALAKPVGLTVPSNAPKAFSTTTYLREIAPDSVNREFGLRVAGLSPGQKNVFGDLPETVGDLAKHEQRVIAEMMKEGSVSERQAKHAWTEVSKFLSDPANLKAMRKVGYLGEGGFLMPNGAYGLGVETMKDFYVHELRLQDFTPGESLKKNTLLGFEFGSPVTTEGVENLVENITSLPDGRFHVQVRQKLGFDTGTKLDAAAIKGLVHGVNPEEYGRIRSGMNLYNKLIGNGAYIPEESKAMALFHYMHDKADPLESMVNTAADTIARLKDSGDKAGGNLARRFISQLEDVGLDYSSEQLVFDSSTVRGLSHEVRDQRIRQAQQIVESMMTEVGTRLRDKTIKGDQFMRTYSTLAQLTPNKDLSYMDFVTRNALPANARAWDHTLLNVPGDASVTFDMLQQMSLHGYHGVAGDIYQRLRFDGDPLQTRQIASYLDGDRGVISKNLALKEALGNRGLGDLSTAEGRAGTIFDPAHDIARGNFMLQMPDGSSVPVLGHDAYGGKVNRYPAGQFSMNERESRLRDLINMHQGGNQDPVKLASSRDAYLSELRKFTYGKESYLRADAVDKLGTGKFIQTRASTLKMGEEVNPFEIGVGNDILKSIRDKEIREALRSGEDVYAAVTRHPVSAMPLVRVRYDQNLKNNIIGMDEGMRGLLMADDDKDMLFAYFMRKGSAGFQEAQETVNNVGGLQHRQLRIQQALEDVKDVSRLVVDEGGNPITRPQSVFDRLNGFVGKALPEAIRRRGASGSIGAFSNTLTEMLVALEHNKNIRTSESRDELARAFFSIRQTPISASKMKNETGLSFSQALGLNKRLRESIRPGASFDQFYGAMTEVMGHAGKKQSSWIQQADTVSLLQEFHTGITPEALEGARNLITTAEQAATYKGRVSLSGAILPYLQGASRTAEGELGMGRKMSTEATAAINQAIKSMQEVKRSATHGGAGKILGIGLGLAAFGGIIGGGLRTPNQRAAIPTFRPPSGSQYRPEDTAGVDGMIPGEPVEGSMAPGNPPRNIRRGSEGVRTAFAAPIHRTTDVEVQMRATDQGRAHETAKIISRLSSGGDSHVTINHRDGTRIQSLRMREKIREQLDQ